MSVSQYTVGLCSDDKSQHVSIEAEDALIAALKVKAHHPSARITYVRKFNGRSDRRVPLSRES